MRMCSGEKKKKKKTNTVQTDTEMKNVARYHKHVINQKVKNSRGRFQTSKGREDDGGWMLYVYC